MKTQAVQRKEVDSKDYNAILESCLIYIVYTKSRTKAQGHSIYGQ